MTSQPKGLVAAQPQWQEAAPQGPVRGIVAGARHRWSTVVLWLELIRNLAVRDVETRYKHSLLGLYWAIVNPLLSAFIMDFVFGVIFHTNSGTVPYIVFLVTGLTFWNLFGNAVSSSTTSITGSASLLAKLYFPRVVMPTAAVIARLIDFAFSLIVVAAFVLIYHVPMHWTALWILPLLVLQLLFALGIGYLVAALNVLYRDVSQLVGLLIMMWMYLSPVMFAITAVPTGLRGWMLVNPMGALIEAERDLMFTGHLSYPMFLWTAGTSSVFVFVTGLSIFKRVEPVFSEVM